MSKERELLKQAPDAINMFEYPELRDEIKAELEKPDQDNKIIAWGASSQSTGRMYYTTSKDEADYWEREYGIIATKLYAEPSLRNSLSDYEINMEHDLNGRDQSNIGLESFRDGVRYAEKARGITGEQS